MNKRKVFIVLFLIIILATIIFIIFKNNAKDKEKWYINNSLIGHALYGIDNNFYTNSYEALEFGYSKGIRIFEADFLLTSDDKLILKHLWENNEILSYEEYMSQQVSGQYTPMDIQNLLLYMQEHKDIYIVVDSKQEDYDETKRLNIYSKLVEEANIIDAKLLDRFIIQLYYYDDFKNIKQIYNFKDYIFTMYRLMPDVSLFQLTLFCKLHNIDVVAFLETDILYNLTSRQIDFMRFCNLKIYTYTINDKATFIEFLIYGINGIYTDSIYPQNF